MARELTEKLGLEDVPHQSVIPGKVLARHRDKVFFSRMTDHLVLSDAGSNQGSGYFNAMPKSSKLVCSLADLHSGFNGSETLIWVTNINIG